MTPVAFSQIARSWQRSSPPASPWKRRFRTRRRRNLPAASQRRRRGALPQPVQPEVRSLPVGVSAERCVPYGHASRTAASNWRTPVMDFHRGLCDFCGRCEQTCLTGLSETWTRKRTASALRSSTRSAASLGFPEVAACAWMRAPTRRSPADASGRPIVDLDPLQRLRHLRVPLPLEHVPVVCRRHATRHQR